MSTDADILESQSLARIPLRTVAFSICVIIVGTIIIAGLALQFRERISLLQLLGLTVVSLLPGFFLGRWLWRRQYVTVTYTLSGSKLTLSKTYHDGASLRGYPKQYDLENLWAAQVTEQHVATSSNQLVIHPAKLILVFDLSAASPNQVTLRHPRVTGDLNQERTLLRRLDTWNAICEVVESRVLARALAPRWAMSNSHSRYWLVIFQSELEFLQGRSTAPHMCLATVRVILNLVAEASRIAGRGLKWAFIFYLVMGGLVLAGKRFLKIQFLINEGGRLNLRFLLLLVVAGCAGIIYGILFSFKPLSAQLERDALVRERQARRLIEAGAKRDDFEPILAFLKNEVDHVQHRLNTLTVATGLPALITLVPRFFTGMSTTISNSILIISLAAFALVQLYFYAQIQILHLATSSCLIAQSELPKSS